jgi:hypothetical protein
MSNDKITDVDGQRIDEPWTNNLVVLARSWADDCRKNAEKHRLSGYVTQKDHNRYGLVTVMVPIIMAAITTIIGVYEPGSPTITVVSTIGFMLGAISSAIYKWLNLGEITQLHWQYHAMYNAIDTDIAYETNRIASHRKPADQFMGEIRMRMQRLEANAPVIPRGYSCCGCSSDIEMYVNEEYMKLNSITELISENV